MRENVFVPLTRHLEHDRQRKIACSPRAGGQVGVAGRILAFAPQMLRWMEWGQATLKEKRGGQWEGVLDSDCDMAGRAAWGCDIALPVTVCAEPMHQGVTPLCGKEKQEGFTSGGGSSPRNHICCPPSVPIWGRFPVCRHIHLPRARALQRGKLCTVHIHGGLWLGTAESWAFILL